MRRIDWEKALTAAGVQPAAPAAASTIASAEAALGQCIPEPVRSLYLSANGLFDGPGQWWVVWPLDRVVDDNLAAWAAGRLDGDLLAFGDDGTGNPFCVSPNDAGRILRWSWNVARVAIARKLLTLVFYGLRDGHIRCLRVFDRRSRYN